VSADDPDATVDVDTPVGRLVLLERDGAIVGVRWGVPPKRRDETALLRQTVEQIRAYFAQELKTFDLPLAPAGSAFERAVWGEMLCIPYGATRTYGELAAAIDGVARAVGGACGSNPIPIVVPCHRVVAARGGLGGYSGAGGERTKRALLTLEGVLDDGPLFVAAASADHPADDKPPTPR